LRGKLREAEDDEPQNDDCSRELLHRYAPPSYSGPVGSCRLS
jgi:hypothetical protein